MGLRPLWSSDDMGAKTEVDFSWDFGMELTICYWFSLFGAIV